MVARKHLILICYQYVTSNSIHELYDRLIVNRRFSPVAIQSCTATTTISKLNQMWNK